MTTNFDPNAAFAFLAAIGDANAVWEFRCIHDTDKALPGVPVRGTLAEAWSTLAYYNDRGYGVFVVINVLDGMGREIANVVSVQAQFIDYDGIGDGWSDEQWTAFKAVAGWQELPPTVLVAAAVPGKFHAYWRTSHTDMVLFGELQRKLIAKWGSDKRIIDPTRVMRLPGSIHRKDVLRPIPVQMVQGSGRTYNVAEISAALAHIDASAAGAAEVHTLGDRSLSAPSLEWAHYALSRIDPGHTDRGEWLKVTAAFKAAAWQWGEPTIRAIWDAWCAQYPGNDPGENQKLWRSIRDTKTGWPYLMRVSGVTPELLFGTPAGQVPAASAAPAASTTPPIPNGAEQPAPRAAVLTPTEQAEYFKGCVLIGAMGRILTPGGRFYDASKFNAEYGGPVFILDQAGAKTTDEPWKAATRGQVFNVTKVDQIRFLPKLAPGAILHDDFGRKQFNTYRPAIITVVEGDASPFVNHLRNILRTEDDVAQNLSYYAHIVQRPGYKAGWAPLIQSAEGAGKGIIKVAMSYAVGSVYTHAPNTQELADSGSKFNAWILNKLLIVADEIRVDEKRDMLEALKPLITEDRIEIQMKGIDQDMMDNATNWIMFTNYRDAIPVTRDSRRYAIYYSTIQTIDDLRARGMLGDYFPRLYAWLTVGGGKEAVAAFLRNYPIDPKYDPAGLAHRAPITSSTAEAIVASFGRVEQAIREAVDSNAVGFRGGWLSSIKVAELMKAEGLRVGPHALNKAYETLGYVKIGRSGVAIWQEDNKQPYLYNLAPDKYVAEYATAQGYAITVPQG